MIYLCIRRKKEFILFIHRKLYIRIAKEVTFYILQCNTKQKTGKYEEEQRTKIRVKKKRKPGTGFWS